MKMLCCVFVLLALSLGGCAERNAGMALGVGSSGPSVSLFSEQFFAGVGSCGGGGVMLGFGGPLSGGDSQYSGGRIIRRTPPSVQQTDPPQP